MTARRRALVWLLPTALLATLLVVQPTPAAAAAGFGCMDANGLMNLQDPDDLLDGRVVLTTGVVVQLGSSTDVDWARTSLDAGSARLLHSLKWVEALVRETRRTGNSAYLDRAVALVLDHARDNPPGGGPDPVDAWYPMYAGQRATAVACVADASGSAAVDEVLRDHGAWLAGVVAGLDAWNQALDPNLGLLAAGCDLGVSSWRTTAAQQFDRIVRGIISPDGVLNEQAPGYGRFVWERLAAVVDKLGDCGMTPPAAVTQRRAALLEWLAWASAPDGRLAPIGDTYATIVPPTPTGASTVWTTTRGASGSHPSETVRTFDDGWVFGRSTWDPFTTSTYWSLRFGPGRDLHGHEDHQSVTFWADGREVLVDSGHAGYADPAYREALRGPEAHNVLLLPDQTFRIRRPTELTRSDSGTGWSFHEVSDDAYGIQDSKVVDAPRTRGVLVLPGHDAMVVQDRLTRRSSGVFEQLWHLVPGATVVSTSRSAVVARHPSGVVDIHVVQVPLPGQDLPRGATTVVTGQTDPYLGWYSDEPDERTAAPVVRARRVGTEARMITVIATTRVGRSVSASPVATSAGWQIALTVDGRSADVGVSTGGGMKLGRASLGSVAPPSGAVPLHGDWDGDGDDERGWFKDGAWGLDPGDGGDTLLLQYGRGGDVPVVGDWDGDGIDSIGVVRGTRWLLRNRYVSGDEALDMYYGAPGDKPVVGDWDGDGDDTIGIVRGNRWVLRNRYVRGDVALDLVYGESSDTPVVGDWDGDGDDTIGIIRGNRWILRNRYVSGNTALDLVYGEATDAPVVGDFDGDGDDTIGIRRDRLWVLRNVYKRSATDTIYTW